MGLSDEATCLASISFSDKEKYVNMEDHNRLTFISGFFGNKPITRVIVDNGSAVNTIPARTLQSVGLTIAHAHHHGHTRL